MGRKRPGVVVMQERGGDAMSVCAVSLGILVVGLGSAGDGKACRAAGRRR